MRTVTSTLLNDLRAAPLLGNLGQPHLLKHPSLARWEDALQSMSGRSWEALQLMTRNRQAGAVNRLNWGRYQDWNGVAAELRPQVVSIAAAAVAKAPPAGKHASTLQASVAWDLLLILLEKEFEDVVEAAFYLPILLPVYQSGHLPCGWTGRRVDTDWSAGSDPLPAGEVVIF